MFNYRKQLAWLAFTINDLFFTLVALVLSYHIRFFSNYFLTRFPPDKGIPPISDFINLGVLLTVATIWIIVFRFNGLSYLKRWRSVINLSLTIFSSVTLAMTILLGVSFFYRGLSYSRVVVGIFWVLDVSLIVMSRLVWRSAFEYFRAKGYNLRRVLIVGAGELGVTFMQKLKFHPGTGYTVVGFIDDDPKKFGKRIDNVKVLGNIDKISQIIAENHVHEVYIALPLSAHKRQLQLLHMLQKECVDVKVIPDLLQYITLRAGIDDLDGIPIINLTQTPMTGWSALFKRLMDIGLAVIGLIITAPITIPVAIIIKLTSPGPVFFTQERMSIDGTRFRMLKFRSMVMDAEKETGPVFTCKDDPRRTKIGVIIRRLSIDELPQLFNVIMGDMSLVGPRPERPPFVEEFRETIPYYMLRHKVRSGMTGWAQINGLRGDTSIRKRIEFDMYYVQNWSLIFDVKIILLTLLKFANNAL